MINWERFRFGRVFRAPAPQADWRATLKRRIIVAVAVLGLWAAGIEARLVSLQVIQRADLEARASRQQLRTIRPPAKRGDILDRRGRVLATSADADTIYAVPSEIDDRDAVVAGLCEAFADCTAKERQSLADRLGRQSAFAYVRRQVSPEVARRVADRNLEGIGFMKESRRFYPNRELAAHVLGYVGTDNSGLAGLEAAYNKQISGKPGQVLIHTDAKRHAFARFEHPSTAGSSIELSIDEYLQHVAERELHAGIVENRAAGGTAIIMNPHTGEILAMANEPTFNPNAYREFDDEARRNRAVQDIYEPGSTFKIVTASAAIEENVMPIDTLIDTNPGQIKIGGRPAIREASGHNYHVLSFTDVIVKSSNVGAIKIGFKVGAERLSRYVERYGFGRLVSTDFPGESPGIVWNQAKWSDSALASVSMGYQVGVTPLQMAAAISAVANGGEFVEPRIVRAIYRDGRRLAVQPRIVRRSVTADTASTLVGIMEQVVERGTAKAAEIPGYTIAGKTGTAAKLVGGHYSHSDYNASFVGFLPSRNPVVTILVVTDSPHNGPTTGGAVSAPIFRRIAEATLQYLGVPPSIDPVPPVLVTRRQEGEAQQTSAPVASPMVDLVADGQPGTVPDVRGLSAREAVRRLVHAGLSARVSGNGAVVSQSLTPGSPLAEGTVCELSLDRAARRPPADQRQ